MREPAPLIMLLRMLYRVRDHIAVIWEVHILVQIKDLARCLIHAVVVRGRTGIPHDDRRQSSKKCLEVLAHCDFLLQCQVRDGGVTMM